MPTVSNHGILGPMTWGANTRQRSFGTSGENGIETLMHSDEKQCSSPPCTSMIANEHAYASGGPPRFISENGYYGYHPAMANGANHQDCSMDTSENNLSLGEHPSPPPSAWGGADGSHADQITCTTWNRHGNATRKRNFEADQEMSERSLKRSRCATNGNAIAETSTLATAQGFGVPTSASSIADQSHSPAQMYGLPVHQLPGSTSHLMDAMTPRPRCLMGHFI